MKQTWMTYSCHAKVAMLMYGLYQSIRAALANYADIILGTLSHSFTHILRKVNTSLSKQIYHNSKSYNVQKCISAPNAIDSKAELDELAKIHLIRHNSLYKSHLVWLIDLRKPKYCGK